MPQSLTISTLIILANYIVLPQWALMILLPQWKWTQKLVDSYLIPFLLGAIYCYFFILVLPKMRSGYTMLTFLRILFSGQKVFLVLWFHILIFDLVVGAWVCQDAIKSSVTWWARTISMVLIMLTGPIGFLIYQGLFRNKTAKTTKNR